jgi:hypothetical protein
MQNFLQFFHNDSWVIIYPLLLVLFILSIISCRRAIKKQTSISFGKFLAWWLIVPYPLAYLFASIYPKDEACGFSGICGGALIGIAIGFLWFFCFPVITTIYLSIKSKLKK